jgi:hypothetical protein
MLGRSGNFDTAWATKVKARQISAGFPATLKIL